MGGTNFNTGKPKQGDTIVWARKRLASSAMFKSEDGKHAQGGVLLADPVGMGKTWEALGASVLLLQAGGRQRAEGKVLVICPPGLISKWEDELSPSGGFIKKLHAWAKRRPSKEADAIKKVFESVIPIRSVRHVRTKKRAAKFVLAPGIYLASYGLFKRDARGVRAIERERWDVIIVDEAHNKLARDALAQIENRRRRQATKLLLTATPFQLEPRQLDLLTKFILPNQRVGLMHRPEMKRFIGAVNEVFEGTGSPPTQTQKNATEGFLKQLITRNQPGRSSRVYSIIGPDGCETPMPHGLSRYNDTTVRELLDASARDDASTLDFERKYLEFRYDLAGKSDRQFLATTLRRHLAGSESARLTGLEAWAEQTLTLDIVHAVKTGMPQKQLVFCSWVGDGALGEARAIQRVLSGALDRAQVAAKKKIGVMRWNEQRARGRKKIEALACLIPGKKQMRASVDQLLDDELSCVLAGSSQRFMRALKHELADAKRAFVDARDKKRSEKSDLVARGSQRRMNDARRMLTLRSHSPLPAVALYTGQEDPKARDLCAAGFRSIGPPWILVASNVGAEGIDLQTYTRHIVHFDLEWNPAKMEQREGRGDRIGRVIGGPLNIHFCIVPRTYDERMFHQLVARDRWHGVLLGKKAAVLARDDGEIEVRLEHIEKLQRCTLDLSP